MITTLHWLDNIGPRRYASLLYLYYWLNLFHLLLCLPLMIFIHPFSLLSMYCFFSLSCSFLHYYCFLYYHVWLYYWASLGVLFLSCVPFLFFGFFLTTIFWCWMWLDLWKRICYGFGSSRGTYIFRRDFFYQIL